METYFKIKTIIEFVVPLIIFTIFSFFFSYHLIISHFKSKLMVKLGYKYQRGLGTNVALEFQPRWEKGNIKINWRRIDSLKYSEIKGYVKSHENVTK
jgi:hypothetical protein